MEGDLFQEIHERAAGTFHQGRVKGCRYLETMCLDSFPGKPLLRIFDCLNGAGENHLLRAVVVGDDGFALPLLEQRLYFVKRFENRGHPAWNGRCLGHEFAPFPGDFEQIGNVQHPCGAQGGHFTEAVTAHGSGLDSHGIQQDEHGQAHGADGGLRPLGCRKPSNLFLTFLLGKDRPREHNIMQPEFIVHGKVVGRIPYLPGLVEVHGQIGSHAHVLAALPREEEGDGSGLRFPPCPVIDAVGEGKGVPRPLRKCFFRLFQLGSQIALVRGNNRQACGERRIKDLLAGPGQIGKQSLSLQVLGGFPAKGLQGLFVFRAHQDQLAGKGAQSRGSRSGTGVLFQGDVEIGPAKPEGTDRCPSGGGPGLDPGTTFRIEIEGAVRDVEPRIRFVHLDRRREHLVVNGKNALEQSRCRCRALCVTDLGLDRTECTPLAIFTPGRLEDHAQSLKFCEVPHNGCRPMGLQQLHGIRTVTRHLVAPLQSLGLTFANRGVYARTSPVRGTADSPDHSINAVSIALRIVQPLESHHPETFSERHSVRLVGKGPAVIGGRKGRGLAEANVHEWIVCGVHAARDHKIRTAQPEFVKGHGQCGKGAGTGSVRRAVHSPQVKAVGDASGHDISQQPRKGAFFPLRVACGHPIADFLDLVFGQASLAKGFDPDGPLDTTDHISQQFGSRPQSEDHTDSITIHFLEPALRRILQDLFCHEKRQELGGVRGGNVGRRNA